MAFEFKFPDLGEGITEGLVVKWRVKEGDKIKEDEALVDVETDKAVVEVPSPKGGTILKLHFSENDTVRVGEVLATIGEAGEQVGAPEKKAAAKKAPPPAKAPERSAAQPQAGRPPSVVGELAEELAFAPAAPRAERPIVAGTDVGAGSPAMPRVRKIAEELGIDLASIHGTGPGGRISEEDVRRTAQERSAADAEKYGEAMRAPFAGTRKSTAEHLLKTCQSAAMVTHFDIVEVTALDELRIKWAAEGSAKVTYLPFFIRAIARALQDFPNFNASLDEVRAEIVYKKYYHIGVAVDTDHGLLVPVIRDADKKGVAELATLIAGFTKRARDRTIGIEELRGGTFTISNIGMVGGIFATPIMPYPQSSILAIGRIKDQPVVRNGKVEVGKTAPLSLTFDHRLMDGADAARFMNHIIDDISNPERLT